MQVPFCASLFAKASLGMELGVGSVSGCGIGRKRWVGNWDIGISMCASRGGFGLFGKRLWNSAMASAACSTLEIGSHVCSCAP